MATKQGYLLSLASPLPDISSKDLFLAKTSSIQGERQMFETQKINIKDLSFFTELVTTEQEKLSGGQAEYEPYRIDVISPGPGYPGGMSATPEPGGSVTCRYNPFTGGYDCTEYAPPLIW